MPNPPNPPNPPDLPDLPDLPNLPDLPDLPGSRICLTFRICPTCRGCRIPDPDPTDDPTDDPTTPAPTTGPTTPAPTTDPTTPAPTTDPTATPTAGPTASPTAGPTTPAPTTPAPTPTTDPTGPGDPRCTLGAKLVPTCGVLWGVAPGAHTDQSRDQALAEFESDTGRTQAIYHAYHRGTEIFPTAMEMRLARDPAKPRLLFLNWKPTGASWAQIARGDEATDNYLDRLAEHIRDTFNEPFFFTVHHEPENDVRASSGSGYTATDYRNMYRYVINRIRAQGVTNLVSVMVHMAYIPWLTQSWWEDLYPGDDVVDWLAWDVYAHSVPGEHGYGDFTELINRTSSSAPDWPGFYNYAAPKAPDQAVHAGRVGRLVLVPRTATTMAELFDSVAKQISLFPRLKAMVYFDTPADQSGKDSRVTRTVRRSGRLPPARPGPELPGGPDGPVRRKEGALVNA